MERGSGPRAFTRYSRSSAARDIETPASPDSLACLEASLVENLREGAAR
jgi:hypothetical protein